MKKNTVQIKMPTRNSSLLREHTYVRVYLVCTEAVCVTIAEVYTCILIIFIKETYVYCVNFTYFPQFGRIFRRMIVSPVIELTAIFFHIEEKHITEIKCSIVVPI